MKFSPDGKTLIAGTGDTEKHALWDVSTGKRYYFRKGIGAFTAVALAPDGKRLATACGPDVHLWDASGEKPAVALEGPGGIVTALAFDEGGKTLTAWSSVARKQWHAGTREVLATESLREEGRVLPRVEVSEDGRTLYTRQGHALSLRDLRSGAARGTIEHVRHRPVFSPDGSLCAIEVAEPGKGRARALLKLWDVTRGKEAVTFADVRGPVVFSPDGRLVAAVSLAAAPKAGVKVWEARTGKEVAFLDGASAPVAFGPAGQLLLARASDGRLLVWEPAPGKKPVALQGAALPAVFTTDNKILTGSEKKHNLTLWDAAGKELASLAGHTGPVTALACPADGKTAASLSSQDRTVRLWDLTGKGGALEVKNNPIAAPGSGLTFTADGKMLYVSLPSGYAGTLLDVPSAAKKPGGVPTERYPVALSADGKLLALGPRPTVRVQDTVTGRTRLVLTTEQDYNAHYSFSADGKALILHTPIGVKAWDLDTGEEVAEYNFVTGRSLSSRPGGASERLRVFTDRDGKPPALFDAETGRKRGTLAIEARGPAEGTALTDRDIASLVLSPDGKILAATSSTPKYIRLWDLASGKVRHYLEVEPGERFPTQKPLTVAFSPDSKTLFGYTAGTGGGLLYRWDLSTGKRRVLPLGGEPGTFVYPMPAALSANGRCVALLARPAAVPGKPYPPPQVLVADLDPSRSRETWAVSSSLPTASCWPVISRGRRQGSRCGTGPRARNAWPLRRRLAKPCRTSRTSTCPSRLMARLWQRASGPTRSCSGTLPPARRNTPSRAWAVRWP